VCLLYKQIEKESIFSNKKAEDDSRKERGNEEWKNNQRDCKAKKRKIKRRKERNK
jgi:hypothetical protein